MPKPRTTARFFSKRTCSGCGAACGWFRPVKRGGKTYYSRTCGKCQAEYAQEWRKKRSPSQVKRFAAYMKKYRVGYRVRSPEKAYGTREWRVLNPELALWDSLRNRCKGRHRAKPVALRLTMKEFLAEVGKVPKRCPVLGIAIRINSGPFSDNSPSVDRVDTTRPYEKGNLAIISYRANALKRNGTADEHRRIAQWMDKHASARRREAA